MRHLGIVASSLPSVPPTVTVSSVTNFNQNRATLNGTVSANGNATTTVKFQISLNDSTWFDAVGGTTITNTSSQSVSVFYNATGYNNGGTVNLVPGTTYYVRLVATNAAGTSNSSSTSFITWSLKAYSMSTYGDTPGTYSFTVPTITPTGGTAIAPVLEEVMVTGGGGGSGYGGGGAGGYRLRATYAFSSGANTSMTIVVGGGGYLQTAGDPSSISGANLTTLSAGGGGAGSGAPASSGGNVGTGDVAFTGGTGMYSTGYDPKTGPYTDTSRFGTGGGAGWGGNGVSAYVDPNNTSFGDIFGGNGGPGGSAYGISGGAGGGGYGTAGSGNTGSFSVGYSNGGDKINNLGVRGAVAFKYYGP
jgi:hypothetical protein